MSKHRRSPLIKLALPRFRRSFGDLLDNQSLITLYERSLLEAIFEQIMWFGRNRDEYTNFERTSRAAYYFLDQGSKEKYESVAAQLVVTHDKIIPAINNSISAKNSAEKSPDDDPDKKIVEYLQYYKTLYERLLPIICAPIVYSFSIYKHIDNSTFIPRKDGQINLTSISKMDQYLTYSENRLSIGLNSHIRNAFSHEYYTILDNSQVKLWDINPWTKKYSWGPEVWHLSALVSLCDQLWVNSLGITCALVIYYINNHNIIERLDYKSRPEPYHLRRGELELLVDYVAEELGFYLREVSASATNVSIILSTKTKGIDQDSELYLGFEKYTQLFKIPMWSEEARVIDQLATMLYLLTPYFDIQTDIHVKIVSIEDEILAELVTDFNTVIGLQLTDAKPETIEEKRQSFKIDTIENLTTYIEREGEPQFVGSAPATPK